MLEAAKVRVGCSSTRWMIKTDYKTNYASRGLGNTTGGIGIKEKRRRTPFLRMLFAAHTENCPSGVCWCPALQYSARPPARIAQGRRLVRLAGGSRSTGAAGRVAPPGRERKAGEFLRRLARRVGQLPWARPRGQPKENRRLKVCVTVILLCDPRDLYSRLCLPGRGGVRSRE